MNIIDLNLMYLITACMSAFLLYTIGDSIYSVIVWKRAKDRRLPHPFVSNANYGRKKKKFGEYKVEQAIADIDLSMNKTQDQGDDIVNGDIAIPHEDDDIMEVKKDFLKEKKAAKKRMMKKKNMEDNLAGEIEDIPEHLKDD
jgi:hypothetical protein